MVKNFIKGLGFGIILGGGAGLLFAPKSGKQMKQDLTSEMDEAASLTTDLNDSLQRFQTALSEVKKTVTATSQSLPTSEKLINKTNFQFSPRLKEINNQLNKIKQQIK